MPPEFDIARHSRLHFIGIGGIGMSGLAAMFAALGCKVTGSDRGADQPENDVIIGALRSQGIAIYPQDGSFASAKPDCLIYSTAIEADNPDFLAAPAIPRLHRACALEQGIGMMQKTTIAVTGSCGKTTVTAWLAETFYNLGLSPSCLDGGLINCFHTSDNAGNFYNGQGDFFIFEADESDKSLLAFHPDYALILNLGTDHYSKAELIEAFGQFASQVKHGIALEKEVYELLDCQLPAGLDYIVFDGRQAPNNDNAAYWRVTAYDNSTACEINAQYAVALPAPGFHNALNATAVLAMLQMLGISPEKALPALEKFSGVWRRFDYAGKLPTGAKVYDDYAHNPEKIASCIKAAQEISPGKVVAIFQPHGFGPLGFMREELFKAMEAALRKHDVFIFLPPYYAGGTSSFNPTSEEIAAEYYRKGNKRYHCFAERAAVAAWLAENSSDSDTVLILGARDNSLSAWAKSLAQA